jgi:acetyl-CoA carboxylase biotin carboxyl carrier protein
MPGAKPGGGKRPPTPAGPRGGAARKSGAAPVKAKPAAADDSGGARAGGFELAELRRLIDLVQSTGIGELEVSTGGRSVRVAALAAIAQAGTASAAVSAPAGAPAAAAAPAGAVSAVAAAPADQLVITSPMVGTFYRAPAPDADPYIEVGDSVTVGQTVCIVEAMKLMNEIESEVRGRVVKILVENAQPVEYGQKLFLVEP